MSNDEKKFQPIFQMCASWVLPSVTSLTDRSVPRSRVIKSVKVFKPHWKRWPTDEGYLAYQDFSSNRGPCYE